MSSLIDPRSLELIIYPTEKCNFRCLYCYEDFKIGRMPPSIIERVTRFIERRIVNIDKLHISWFGGEPLLADRVILSISKQVSILCAQNDVEFTGSMTTNGYCLTLQLATQLAKFNQNKYQISLDGMGEDHNKTRRRADGKGTFDVIWNNLKKLHASDLEFNILLRLHVHKENVQSIRQLIEILNVELLPDKRFKAVVKAVGDWGGNNLMIERLLDEKEQISVTSEMKLKIMSLDVETSTPHVCYASRPNSLVIRADGRIQKCTVMQYDNRNHVGDLGDDGSLKLNRARMGMWMRGFENFDLNTLSCPVRDMPLEDTVSKIPCIQVM